MTIPWPGCTHWISAHTMGKLSLAQTLGGVRKKKNKVKSDPDSPTLSEVLQSQQVEDWIKAIAAEMGGLKENKVGRKAIPSQLIFNVKLELDGSITKLIVVLGSDKDKVLTLALHVPLLLMLH